MATERVLHPEWRDEGEPTKYPFADEATLRAADGAFIPESLFLDAVFYPIGGGTQLYLSQVELSHQEAVLTIGDEVNSAIAYGTVDILNPADSIRFVDLYGRPAGLIVSEAGRLALFQAWQTGIHHFTADATGFAATCCIPTPEIGVRGILLADGSLFVGDIWIVGETGVVLTAEAATYAATGSPRESAAYNYIRVDIVGDPLFRRSRCEQIFTTPRFLEQITVQDGCRQIIARPDQYGDFKITVGHQDAVDTVLRIRTTPEGLVFEAVGEPLKSIR
jgi:hypothetical protein